MLVFRNVRQAGSLVVFHVDPDMVAREDEDLAFAANRGCPARDSRDFLVGSSFALSIGQLKWIA